MYYSSIGLLAALILLIENHDILFGGDDSQIIPVAGVYRKFLIAVLVYYATDMLWGVLDSLHLILWLFADTVIYFVAMASGVLLWTRYVIGYLAEENVFSRCLCYAGRIFFGVVLIVSAVNCFEPVLFWFDENGTYQAHMTRHVLLAAQILLFLLSSIYAFRVMRRGEGAEKSVTGQSACSGWRWRFSFFSSCIIRCSHCMPPGICWGRASSTLSWLRMKKKNTSASWRRPLKERICRMNS